MLGKKNRILGAILLISGTTIGAAMLALPVTTGLAGFFPSLILMAFLWLFMMLTAFFFLEVNLKMEGESNLITMARKTLGKKGEALSWIVYLALLYSLVAAYLVGGGQLLGDFFKPLQSVVSAGFWPLVIFIVFGSFIYLGVEVSDLLNRLLMLGLGLAYILLLIIGVKHIEPKKLEYVDPSFITASISVMVTSFGYHIIIPTLTTYLDHNKKALRLSIIIGSLIPFVVYLLWEALVLGILPIEGPLGLKDAAQKGMQATIYLKELLQNPYITVAARIFAFFAIVTSLLGVSLSLIDFLADGLKIKRTRKGKLILVLLTFIPPLCFAYLYPSGFIVALKYAGIFVIILLALLPTLMVWSERYSSKVKHELEPSSFKVAGGKGLLVLSILISLFLLVVEVIS